MHGMADVLYPPSRPQSVGEILDSAFRIFGVTLLSCLPYAALAAIISQLPSLHNGMTADSFTVASLLALWSRRVQDPLWWVVFAVSVCGSLTLTNAVTRRQYALMTGRRPATRDELAIGARRFPGVLLIVVLLSLPFVGSYLSALAVLLVGPSSLLITIGLLILGSWLGVRWLCSWVIYLVTDRGVLASLSHSWFLTAGNVWRMSLICTVGLAMILVVSALAPVLGGMASLLFARGDFATAAVATTVVATLLQILIAPFYSALSLAMFGDLSVRREGIDIKQRISAPAIQ